MKRPIVLFLYAVLVLAAGLYVFTVAPDRSKAGTALMAPGTGAGVAFVLGVLLAVTKKPIVWRIAIGFITLFGLAVLSRAIPAMGDETKAYLVPVLFTIVGLSVAAVVGLVIPQTRPAPAAST